MAALASCWRKNSNHYTVMSLGNNCANCCINIIRISTRFSHFHCLSLIPNGNPEIRGCMLSHLHSTSINPGALGNPGPCLLAPNFYKTLNFEESEYRTWHERSFVLHFLSQWLPVEMYLFLHICEFPFLQHFTSTCPRWRLLLIWGHYCLYWQLCEISATKFSTHVYCSADPPTPPPPCTPSRPKLLWTVFYCWQS